MVLLLLIDFKFILPFLDHSSDIVEIILSLLLVIGRVWDPKLWMLMSVESHPTEFRPAVFETSPIQAQTSHLDTQVLVIFIVHKSCDLVEVLLFEYKFLPVSDF